MAEGKKIKYEDLFDPKLDDQVKQLEATFTSLKDSLKEFAAVAGKEIKMTGMKTPEDMQKLAKGINDVETAAKSLKIVEDEEIKAKLRWTEAERERTAALKAQVKEEKAAEGSINQLRARLSAVTLEWAKLSKEERENTKAGKDIVNSKKQLTEELKKLEAATGDHRRNVGNYTEALKGLPGAFGGAINSAIDMGKQLWALAMNPVALTIAAIGGALVYLFKAFTSTDEGGKKLDKVLNMISATLDVVRQRAAQFADGLIDFFSGNWEEAGKKMSESFQGIGEQISAAAAAADKYTEALDAIDDRETSYISKRAENSKKIAELEFIASDPSQLKGRRIKALEDAISLGQEELKFNKDQATQRYNIELEAAAARLGVKKDELKAFIEADDVLSEQILKNNASIAKARNMMNDDGQKALEEFYAASVKAEEDYYERFKGDNKKLEKLKEDILKADIERRKKASEDLKKGLADYVTYLEDQKKQLDKLAEEKEKKHKDSVKLMQIEREGEIQDLVDRRGRRETDLMEARIQMQKMIDIATEMGNKLADELAKELASREKLQQDADQKAIDNQKKQVDRQAQLAAQGRENSLAAEEAQLARAERKKIDDQKKAQKQQEALELAKVFLNLVAEYSKENPNNATAKALAMTLIAKGISKSIAGAFATGVEGLDGEGTETSDSNIALLSKGESVITARGTKSNPGLATAMNTGTVDEYFKDVYMPQFASSNRLDIPKAEQVNNALFKVLTSELSELKQAIREKPVSMTKLNGLGEWTEEVQSSNMRIITHHRKGGNRF